MRKRIGIYLTTLLVLAGVLWGYQWFENRQVRIGAQKQIDEFVAQQKALESLGDVEIETSELTLAKLEERFHKHSIRLPGAKNSSRLGWACWQSDCLISASFAVGPGEEISRNEVPAALVVIGSLGSIFGSKQHLSVGGAYIGEPVEQFKASARKRGYGVETGYNRITRNKDWSIVWADTNGKISLLSLLNERIFKSTQSDEDSRGDVSVRI